VLIRKDSDAFTEPMLVAIRRESEEGEHDRLVVGDRHVEQQLYGGLAAHRGVWAVSTFAVGCDQAYFPPLNTFGASGIAAPSWRGSDPAKCAPVPSLITAWP
jgi:hypothetical protein